MNIEISSIEQKFIKILLDRFPDKVINKRIRKEKIYACLFQQAKIKNITLNQYVEYLGFTYNLGYISEQKYIETLLALYPDKVITSGFCKEKIYSALTEQARKKNILLKKYIEQLGFIYKKNISKSQGERAKQNHIDTLLALYPDRVIKPGFRKEKIYSALFHQATKNNMQLKQYVEELLGFEYRVRDRSYMEEKRYIIEKRHIEKLLALYPDRIIKSDVYKEKIYRSLVLQSKWRNILLKQYIELLGFEYK